MPSVHLQPIVQCMNLIQKSHCRLILYQSKIGLRYHYSNILYFSVGSFLFSVLDCALMMAVTAFSQGQLSRTDPVGSSHSHGRSGARSGGSLSVRPAPPHLRCADDRSDCRSDRSSLSDGPQPPPELATAGTATGKRHAAAPPIGAECVPCVVGVLGVEFKKI